MYRLRVISLIVLFTGCAPQLTVGRLWPTPLPPNPVDHPIAIFRENRPRCAFDEIATIEVKPSEWASASADELIEAMRVRARAAGGDAIIGYGTESRATGAVAYPNTGITAVSRTTFHSGTIIRYRDAACRE